MNFSKALAWVNGFGYRGFDFDLDRFKKILTSFNSPQEAVPVIHLAGTNGKGSVGAMLESALLEHNLSVGFYSSPHLTSICERYRLNGREISKKEFSSYATTIRRHLEKYPKLIATITHFEILTLLSFLFYSKKKPEVLILETGLGGRLDATNVVENKLAAVITSIGLDHEQWLGRSPEKIAWEKAGIFRKGVPAILSAQSAASATLKNQAILKKAPIFLSTEFPLGKNFGNLVGTFQQENRQTTYATLMILSELWKPLSPEKIKRGFQKAKWPGRFELLQKKPFPIVLDGAHNVQAAEALLNSWKREGYSSGRLIFSALQDKDWAGMAKTLTPLFKEIALVPLEHERARKMGSASILKPWRGKAFFSESWQKALSDFSKHQEPVLIAGSLVLAGSVKRVFGMDP